MRPVTLGLALLAVLIAGGYAAAAADYTDNFDSYVSGTQSPATTGNPWTQSTTMASCFGGFVQNLSPTSLALSPPNVYSFSGSNAAGCFTTTQNLQIALTATASSSTVTVSFFYNVFTPTAGNNTGYVMQVSVCGQAATGFVFLARAHSYWTKASLTETATPGAACQIAIGLFSQTGATPTSVAVAIDNVYVKGASVFNANANTFLYDFNTGFPLNMTLYPANTETVQYTSGASFYAAGQTTYGFNLPWAGATLVTICLTNLYCNTVVPPQTGTISMYFAPPASALACLFIIASPTGQFPQGTQITILSGTKTMASGYLDGSFQFPAFLPPGHYTVNLASGSNAFSTSVTVSSVSTSFTIPVLGLTGNAFSSGAGTLSYNAGWDAGLANVVYFFSDSSTSTTFVKVQLLRTNQTGQFILNTATFSSGPYGTVQGSISCASNQCNSTLSAQLAILFTVTSQFGYLQPFGPVGLTVGAPGIAGTPPGSALGGMNEWFPAINYLNLGAFFALVVVASAFGEYDAPIGAIVMGLMAAILVALGALPLGYGVVAAFIVVGILDFLQWREKRSLNPYG